MEQNLEKFTVGKREIFAAKMGFFIPGFAISTWGPMIPFVKERLQIPTDILGILLLCVGISAFLMMPVSGFLSQKFGCKKVIIVGSIGMALNIVFLSFLPSVWLYGVFLLLIGGFMGILDVSVNVNAVMIEKISKKRLMSGMHGFWSVGCFASAGLFSLLATSGVSVFMISIIHCLILLAILLFSGKYFLAYKGSNEKQLIAIPKGIIILFGTIACIAFLGEGAIMDWSGIFLTEVKALDLSLAGFGYAVFSVAMLVFRLIGDKIVQLLGENKTVIWGTLIGGIGYLVIIFIDNFYLMPIGYILVGLGSANIVPVLYSMLKHQNDMPINSAVTAVSSMGYSGVILGPAMLGFVAHGFGITSVFMLLGILFFIQVAIARYMFTKLN